MMKSTQYPSQICVHKTFFFIVLLSHEIFCSLHLPSSTSRDETAAAENREILETNLKSLGADLTESVKFNDRQLTETLLSKIKNVWQRITQQHIAVSPSVDDDVISSNDDDLMHYAARLLFLAKDRHCESPFETFFKDQCLPIRNIEDCPENMELYDGPNNEGFCDCSDVTGNNSLRVIYWDQTGKCYFQNTRGPCDVGQWFVLKDVPKCEVIPEGCPADGQHVYGNIGISKNSVGSKCWKIGNPCTRLTSNRSSFPPSGVSQVMQVEQSDDGNLRVFCDVKKHYVKASSAASLGINPSCDPGTYRNRFGKCIRGFFG